MTVFLMNYVSSKLITQVNKRLYLKCLVFSLFPLKFDFTSFLSNTFSAYKLLANPRLRRTHVPRPSFAIEYVRLQLLNESPSHNIINTLKNFNICDLLENQIYLFNFSFNSVLLNKYLQYYDIIHRITIEICKTSNKTIQFAYGNRLIIYPNLYYYFIILLIAYSDS